jgi:hypothetical protein
LRFQIFVLVCEEVEFAEMAILGIVVKTSKGGFARNSTGVEELIVEPECLRIDVI